MPKYASHFKALFSKTSFIVLMYLSTSTSVFSQVQVVDAGADNPSSQAASQAGSNNTASSNGNEIVVTLYNMVEALQREVQTLRGLVEEQTYQIRRMENEQRDRYLDVDGRLSELNQRMSSAPGNGIGGALGNSTQQGLGLGGITEPSSLESAAQDALNPSLNNSTNPIVPTVIEPALAEPALNLPSDSSQTTIALGSNIEPKSEEELYQEARNLLLNDGEFESSISVFQQMIEDYPQGRLAPNAYYWQGEALILVERYSQAISVFNQVVDDFPTHEKAPDSMLKLGIVYSLMDNERRAQQVWRELLEDFADSGSASLRLAEVYLRDGYNR